MIYTQWGNQVEIVAYAGKHKPFYASHPMVLVKIKYDNGDQRFAFAYELRADDGIAEIEDAVDAAPEITLSDAELKAALKEAE